MSADRDDADLDRNSAWLAAYALGLVYSANDADRRLAELLATSDGRHDLLASARGHLHHVEVTDPAIRTQALSLLDQALERQPSDTPDQTREPPRRPEGMQP